MPTAAKMVSALFFAGLGYLLSSWLSVILSDYFLWGPLEIPVVFVGLWLGWQYVGTRAEEGFRMAMAAAITSSALLLVSTAAISSFATMINRALILRYGGLMAGLEDMFDVMAATFVSLARADVAIVVLGAGCIGGLIAFLVARAWR